MDILQLRYFLTAAHMENISRAAMYHRVPQPAMSKTVSNLEKELGVTLFDRTNNHLRLNENGRIFAGKIAQALGLIDDAVTNVREQQEIAGEIRLLVLANRRIVTECIAQFKQKYADVTFRIAHNRTEQPFEFDLCVSADPLQEENLCAVSLMREELRLAVAVKDPMAQQKNVNFAALKDRRFVLMPEPNSVNRMVTMLGAQNGFTPQIGILCDDPLYVRKYVAMGLGVTLAPMVSWKGLFGTDTVLIPLNDAGQPIYRTTHLFWHEHRSMPQRVKLFRSLIMESFAAESV